MMLSTMKLIGCLPNLGDEPLDWLPIDIATEAFLQAWRDIGGEGTQMNVYHVLNEHKEPTWNQMLRWLQKKETFDIVTPEEWVRRLEAAQDSGHPALKLLGLWKEAYCNASPTNKARPRFSLAHTKEKVPILREIQPLNEEYVEKIWNWVQANVG